MRLDGFPNVPRRRCGHPKMCCFPLALSSPMLREAARPHDSHKISTDCENQSHHYCWGNDRPLLISARVGPSTQKNHPCLPARNSRIAQKRRMRRGNFTVFGSFRIIHTYKHYTRSETFRLTVRFQDYSLRNLVSCTSPLIAPRSLDKRPGLSGLTNPFDILGKQRENEHSLFLPARMRSNSVGRVRPCQGRCRRFEPGLPLQNLKLLRPYATASGVS